METSSPTINKATLLLITIILIWAVIIIILIVYFNAGSSTAYPSSHLINQISNEVKKDYGNFIVSYNKTLKMSNYALYNLFTINSNRCNKKPKQDTQLNTLHSDDYKYSNFDRGHLVPSKDVENSCDTFVMSNIVPQLPCFNRGIWRKVEDYIRTYYDDFDILTVPEYDLNNFYNNKNIKLYVPTGFYKIVLNEDSVVCSIYLKHNFETCGKKIEDVAVFGKLPYMLKNQISIKKCLCIENKESWC